MKIIIFAGDMNYTIEDKKRILDAICNSIVSGKSLRTALKENNFNTCTFFDWIGKNDEMAKQYARAMEIRAQMMFEDMLDIANEKPERMATEYGDRVDNGDVQDKKVKIDAMKWGMAKMMPKKYGDKIDDHSDKTDNEIIIKLVGDDQSTD